MNVLGRHETDPDSEASGTCWNACGDCQQGLDPLCDGPLGVFVFPVSLKDVLDFQRPTTLGVSGSAGRSETYTPQFWHKGDWLEDGLVWEYGPGLQTSRCMAKRNEGK